ncbi:PREDICTED: rab-like protein 3 isoform X2 [Bactrocera latifrons]|uniref:rab-like protein 3 isoform X2 n=1 Tax=Bactrocera latifrons TaxID=174628 RepID=UPI0008DD52AF|nr:PREDICTED: rab-like protein 3 isoform X2 [Bactrocera latifrons]
MVMANNIEKARVLIVGDSGVGKTCLTHLIAHSESLTRPGWTVGCNIEVKLHEYKEGTPHQKTYFIELFDIVHDLTNRKSQENLRHWLFEILNKDGKDNRNLSRDNTFDPEQFLGSTQLPMLVVGAKLDLSEEKRKSNQLQKIGSIAEHCGSEEIWLNCRDSRSFAAGTTDAVKLSRFFDRVIEKKNHSRDPPNASSDRRKHASAEVGNRISSQLT